MSDHKIFKNNENLPDGAEKVTPPANFHIEHARIGDGPVTEGFKAAYLRLRLLTELAAIKIIIDGAFPECFEKIESAIKALTINQIFDKHQELERNL